MNTENMQSSAPCAANGGGAQPVRQYRPALRFYHANGKGTGCALKLELHPAHDTDDGSIWATVAQQISVGNRCGPNPTFSRFDWENPMCIKLDFGDICRMLQVFRGECESLENGNGLIHQTARATTHIHLAHVLEPLAGYSLDVRRTSREGVESHAHIFFYPWEALGIAEAFAGSLAVVSFGIPVVIPRDTSAYRAENREARRVHAA